MTTTTTQYVNPGVEQMWCWIDSGKCPWCGSVRQDPGTCYCRYCDSCSRTWIAATTADYDERDQGGRAAQGPKWEDCPECASESSDKNIPVSDPENGPQSENKTVEIRPE